MTFTVFRSPAEPGFAVIADRSSGLRNLLLAAGRLPAGDVGPVHVHDGDEIIRVLSGELVFRLGDERRTCRAGDVVVVPPGVRHGFTVVRESELEVVAEHDIGTLYPVQADDETEQLVEVHRRDMPWGRPPPAGTEWTSDEQLHELLGRISDEA